MGNEFELTRRRTVASAAVVAMSGLAGCTGTGSSGDDQGLETTFDEGKEDWSAVDLTPLEQGPDADWTNVIRTLDLTHEQARGVDDSGYVTRVDSTSDAFFFDAPDTYLGDRSAYAGGTLEFYLKSTGNDYRQDSGVVFEGPDGVVATKFAKPGTDWTQFSIELDAEARSYREPNLEGSEVGQQRLEAVLSDLQALRISGEHASQVEEEVGLDEVRLRQA